MKKNEVIGPLKKIINKLNIIFSNMKIKLF